MQDLEQGARLARVFGVSAMYTGVAGALSALVAGFVAPDSFTFLLSIAFLIGGVVGGVASIFGSLFGAAFIELVPDLAKQASELWPSLHWLADVQWPAYGVLRAVELPAGSSSVVVEFRYRPWSWRVGAMVSLISLCLLALLVGFTLFRSRFYTQGAGVA